MPAIPEVREAALMGTTGSLVAWDPVAKKEAWRIDFDGPWNGGTLATAGNLVFQGNARENFVAYAADTGRELWSFPAQTGIIAAPMTYAIDGEQYVAILAGWGGVWDIAPGIMASKSGRPRNISRLLVFKLGGTATLPPAPPHTGAGARPAGVHRHRGASRSRRRALRPLLRRLPRRRGGLGHAQPRPAALAGDRQRRRGPLGGDRRRAASTTAWSRSRKS